MQQLPSLEKKFISSKYVDRKTKVLFKHFVDLTRLASKDDKEIYAYGGFAVDLAVEKITRPHNDLDLSIPYEDFEWFKSRLEKLGFTVTFHPGANPKYTLIAQKPGIDIEAGALFIKGEEVGDWDKEFQKKWVWPIKLNELIWERKYDDITLKFINPYLTYDFKKRQQIKSDKREKDISDFIVLEAVFPDIQERIKIFH